MTKAPLINQESLADLRGALRLATDATVGVTELVESMHHTIQLAHPPIGTSKAGNTNGLTGLIYRSIRGATRLVGRGLDAGLAPFSGLLPETASTPTRDAFVSAINGISGDHLVATNNPLTIKMAIRYQGLPLDVDNPGMGLGISDQTSLTGKVMIFVHGLCLNENHWTRDGHNQSESLAIKLGYTPLYLRYNTGLPISENGNELALVLESIMRDWPVPLSELVMIGHSMGGLVARSAAYHGKLAEHDWLQQLRSMVFIGSPHHGAPLERGGNWLNYAMGLSPYAKPFTSIAGKRSAGIADLRHGNITSKDREVVALPIEVDCYAMAATLGKNPGPVHERFVGDGLVPVDSALGQGRDPACSLQFKDNHQWLGFETGHIELLGSADVYKQIQAWLE